MLRNTQHHYGAITKAFHWVLALLIIGMVIFGFVVDEMERSPLKGELMGLHKSIGVTILLLGGTRLLWRFVNPRPRMDDAPRWQLLAAHGVHALLYALILAMPITGWGMSSAAGYPVSMFGLFTLPPLVDKNEEWNDFFYEAHELLAFAIIGLVVVHVGAALYHHWVRKDQTLRRMLPFVR